MANRKPITFDTTVRALLTAAVIVVIFYLIYYLRNVLLPFCVACIIAYLLEPLVTLQQRRFKMRHRAVPVLLTLLEAGIVVGAVCYFFIPSIINEIGELDRIVKASDGHKNSLMFIPPEVEDYIRNYLSYNNIVDFLNDGRITAVLNKSTTALAATVDFLMHTLEWLMTFIYVIFIMLDYKQLMSGFHSVVPPRYRDMLYPVFDDIKNNMNSYFRSQAVIAACAAVLYCIGFSIVGLPMAIVMGIMVGVLYMIPYFQYITILPVMVLCYIYSLTGECVFWTELGKCALVYVISQSICDYMLTPKIMGKTLGLNPAIILLSLSVWGSLMGIIGMIIALPVTSLLIAYYKRYVLKPVSPDAGESSTAAGRHKSVENQD